MNVPFSLSCALRYSNIKLVSELVKFKLSLFLIWPEGIEKVNADCTAPTPAMKINPK